MGDPVYQGATYDSAKALCIVIHGRGQTQADMLSLIVDRLDVPQVRFALPKSDATGWYGARAVDPLTAQTSTELDAGLDRIAALIVSEKEKAPDRPVLLCGFSQGACMSVELIMRRPEIANAAALLTGCRIGADSDALPLAQLAALPVYASCGDADPWIPQAAYHRMLGDLTRAGARIRTDMFPGRSHSVAEAEIGVLADMLGALVSGKPVFEGVRA